MRDTLVLTLEPHAGAASLAVAGGKGASLVNLIRAGLPVPSGFIITTSAYRQFVEANDLAASIREALAPVMGALRPSAVGAASRTIQEAFISAPVPPTIADAVRRAYARLDDQSWVAVRSSATAEDLPDLSFAGQQDTYLNIRGNAAVLDAVRRCWASLWTARAIDYRIRHGVDQEAIDLAVVTQVMVDADTAGIMFTANPMNGDRSEVVINASWGLGEAIVGGTVSPDTFIVDKAAGSVKHTEIADKATMTATASAGTADRPVPDHLRRVATLDEADIRKLVEMGRQIENFYGFPQDVEWCRAEGAFHILQARPITTLSPVKASRIADRAPLVEVSPPTEWIVPNRRARYMRNNIVELIRDPMTPLFATLGRRVINDSMNALMAQFIGMLGVMPEQLIITINGYAYYNGEFSAKQIGQILLNSIGIARYMFTGAEQRWRDAHESYVALVAERQDEDWHALPSETILGAASHVLGEAITYYGALVSGLIPAAWISEGLFTFVYDRLIKRKSDPRAAAYLLGFDSIPILAEKSLYELAEWARSQGDLATYMLQTPTSVLADQRGAPSGVETQVWQVWRDRFDAYLKQYGGTIYDLDFAKPTPADDPTPVIATFKLFLQGQGVDPRARQKEASERRQAAVEAAFERLRGFRLKRFRKALARAQKYAPQREDGLATLGVGYPLIRQMLLEVGGRLAEAGAISQAGDIFWLKEEQAVRVAAAADRGELVASMAEDIARQKALWRARKSVAPPMALPMPPKFIRKLFPTLGGVEEQAAGGATAIRGTACSPGIVTARARVLSGPEDFDGMQPGEVLVAAITTPAWTPLFAMAAAVVTDIGGPLSHGSIVAREYGIPAVLGTGSGTRRLRSGDLVRVDGAKGTVEVLESV